MRGSCLGWTREFALLMIVLPLAELESLGQGRGGMEMPANYIKAELGEVSGQLIEYRYQEIPKEQRTKGQREALVSAHGWLQSIGAAQLQPTLEANDLIHNGDSTSCDAVRIAYALTYQFGELALEISQTIFVITVTIVPRPWPANWKDNSLEAATVLAQRFFRNSRKVNLRLEKQLDGVSLGRQAGPESATLETGDWLETLQWWCDGTTIGFVLLKRTGPGQSVTPSLDLESNKVWFQMFERSRTR